MTHLMARGGAPDALRPLPDAMASRRGPRLPGGPPRRHQMGHYQRSLVLVPWPAARRNPRKPRDGLPPD